MATSVSGLAVTCKMTRMHYTCFVTDLVFFFFCGFDPNCSPSPPREAGRHLRIDGCVEEQKGRKVNAKKTKTRRDLFPQIAGPSPRKRAPLVGAAYGTDWQNSKPAWPLSSRARVFFVVFGFLSRGSEGGCASIQSYVITEEEE